jgi:hypothetical protein
VHIVRYDRDILIRFRYTAYTGSGRNSSEMTHSQSWSIEAMCFHHNVSLASINIAKCKAIREKVPLSMASVKVLMHNEFLLRRLLYDQTRR